MGKIVTQGQLLFGIAIAALGIENLVCAHFRLTDPGVPWFPVNPFFGYINGIALSVAGLSIAAKFHARLAAMLLGYLFFGYVLFLEVPLVISHLNDWTAYGVLFEALALGASAWTLAHTMPPATSRSERGRGSSAGFQPPSWSVLGKATIAGPYLFAVSLLVFGSIHFVVARFIASLIPAWIPGSLFWAYLTGTAMIAAGISIAVQRLDQWAGLLLGVMFLLWVVLLHSARVAADPGNADEWSSGLIALAMCGGSWIVATHARRANSPI